MQGLSVVDLCSLGMPISWNRLFRLRDYRIVGSWSLGPFLDVCMGNLFTDFWGSFSTSHLGCVKGASAIACVRFSDTPVAVFRTQPWPFFGHTRGRFSATPVSVFRTHLWPFSVHDRVRFSDTIVSAFGFKKIPSAIFFWAAFEHLKPNAEKTGDEKRTRFEEAQRLRMRAGSQTEPLSLLDPWPFFVASFFQFWFQIPVFGEKNYGHRQKKTWPPPAKINESGTSLDRPPAASQSSIGCLGKLLGTGGGKFQEASLESSRRHLSKAPRELHLEPPFRVP